MADKLIDHEASIDVDDDGDIFIEMIFRNGRVGLTFGHDLKNTGVFSTGRPHDETTRLFNAPQSDIEANSIREHFVKLLELLPERNSGDSGSDQWTTALPTEPGWYWVRVKRDPNNDMDFDWSTIAEVWGDGSHLYVFSKAFVGGKVIEKAADLYSHWIGPLPSPEPPI